MLPIVDKPAIQYVVEEAVAAGLDDVLMVTGRNKRALEDHFDRNVELEAALEAKGDDERLARVREAERSAPTSTTSARATRAASATPCSAPRATSATSRSRCCSATT